MSGVRACNEAACDEAAGSAVSGVRACNEAACDEAACAQVLARYCRPSLGLRSSCHSGQGSSSEGTDALSISNRLGALSCEGGSSRAESSCRRRSVRKSTLASSALFTALFTSNKPYSRHTAAPYSRTPGRCSSTCSSSSSAWSRGLASSSPVTVG